MSIKNAISRVWASITGSGKRAELLERPIPTIMITFDEETEALFQHLEWLASEIKSHLEAVPLFQEDAFAREFAERYHLTARTRPQGEFRELERVIARLTELQRGDNLTAYHELVAEMKMKTDAITRHMRNLFDDDQFVMCDTALGELIIFGQGDSMADSCDMDALIEAISQAH